jgi:hypothetical protein
VAGIRFDPAAVGRGSSIGNLTIDSIAATPTALDSSLVGTARFAGELILAGRIMAHPDPELQALCFEADSGSAQRMPRWAGDTRRSWFCFSNREEAAGMIGSTAPGKSLTVVIDRFTIHRGMSDEVNSARLVRVVP